MKLRTDFVTNSSSSSYIIIIDKDHLDNKIKSLDPQIIQEIKNVLTIKTLGQQPPFYYSHFISYDGEGLEEGHKYLRSICDGYDDKNLGITLDEDKFFMDREGC